MSEITVDVDGDPFHITKNGAMVATGHRAHAQWNRQTRDGNVKSLSYWRQEFGCLFGYYYSGERGPYIFLRFTTALITIDNPIFNEKG